MCKSRVELREEYRRQQRKKLILDYLGAVAFFGMVLALWICVFIIASCI